jgi:hypothetical protein
VAAQTPFGIAMLPGGRVVMSWTEGDERGGVTITNLDGREIARVEGEDYLHACSVRATADGSMVVVAQRYGAPNLWCWKVEDLLEGRPPTYTLRVANHPEPFWLEPDGTIIVVNDGHLVAMRRDQPDRRVPITGARGLRASAIDGTAKWLLIRGEEFAMVVDRRGKVRCRLPNSLVQYAAFLDDETIVAASGAFAKRIYGGDDKAKLSAVKLPAPEMRDGFVATFDAGTGAVVQFVQGRAGNNRGIVVIDGDTVATTWDAWVAFHPTRPSGPGARRVIVT